MGPKLNNMCITQNKELLTRLLKSCFSDITTRLHVPVYYVIAYAIDSHPGWENSEYDTCHNRVDYE